MRIATDPAESCCWHGTVDEFLNISTKDWLKEMEERYPYVYPPEFELEPENIEGWLSERESLMMALSILTCDYDEQYGDLDIVCEFAMPQSNPSNGRNLEGRVWCDAVLVSNESLVAMEFKDRTRKSIGDGVWLRNETDKYRRHLKRWHLGSAGLKKYAVCVLTAESRREWTEKMQQVLFCDTFALPQIIDDCFKWRPEPIDSLDDWLTAAWVDRTR